MSRVREMCPFQKFPRAAFLFHQLILVRNLLREIWVLLPWDARDFPRLYPL